MDFEEERRRLNPLYGIGLFLIIMVLFIFVFAPLQYHFGMMGLLLTELGLLAVTLLAVRFTGQSFREVFPIYRPRFGQILGTIPVRYAGNSSFHVLFPRGISGSKLQYEFHVCIHPCLFFLFDRGSFPGHL